ncbi:hypothetical protein L2E82_44739 [Cichorium intybus]|uniref:Uncharacterized protein n=1 Tax=Cichorium intybus TaxID=13427 RepID=A0ACB8ZRF2_CICIN|nr:hypothetical protein L2E82_44739 [Cichorium intybus]
MPSDHSFASRDASKVGRDSDIYSCVVKTFVLGVELLEEGEVALRIFSHSTAVVGEVVLPLSEEIGVETSGSS